MPNNAIFIYKPRPLLSALIFAISASIGWGKGNHNDSLWIPILKTLNEPGDSPTKAHHPATNAIEDDLMAINQNELLVIEKKWQAKASSLKVEDRKQFKLAANAFFHDEITKLNENIFIQTDISVAANKSRKINYQAIAEKVLAHVRKNPVASPDNVQNFKQGNQIGFCFGRALLIHYLLLKEGIPQRDIAKIFMLGELLFEKTIWRFHVAVMVPDSTSGFLVIDPLQKTIRPYKKWLEINQAYDIKTPLSRVRFYITDARKFLPSFGVYDLKQLAEPALKDYFDALGKSL